MSGRPSFLVAGDSVVYSAAIRKKWAVQKLRVSDGVAVWRHEGERPGHATAPESHGGQISFCLDGTLYMVEQEEGELVQQVSLPRLDLLFSPRRIGEDLLLGYSTWSSCGLLRYCRGKVDWRYKRRAQGPVQFPRVLYGGEVGVVVRDDRELIGVDLSTGDEAWRCPATPWLYTEVIERGGQLIFGTSGAGGRLVAVDPSTGVVTWSVEVEDGCAFFTETSEDLVFAGRCGRVFRVKKSSGAVIDEVATESILCGDIISDQNAVVAVGLDGSGDSLSLVCVSLDA